MITTNIYTRRFSEIGYGIQAARTLEYDLCKSEEDGTECYGIHIISHSGNRCEEDIIQNISINKGFVMGIIRYLFENSVDVPYLRDIVEDLIANSDIVDKKCIGCHRD